MTGWVEMGVYITLMNTTTGGFHPGFSLIRYINHAVAFFHGVALDIPGKNQRSLVMSKEVKMTGIGIAGYWVGIVIAVALLWPVA